MSHITEELLYPMEQKAEATPALESIKALHVREQTFTADGDEAEGCP